MGLLPKSKSSATEARAGASTDAGEVVRDARTRARRRLIGAALLLGVGIIGFPLLFENQPRPIPVDIPIDIPSREAVKPPASPSTRPAPRPGPSAALPKPPVEAPPMTAPTTAAVSAMPSASATAPRASAPAQAKPAEAKPADAGAADAAKDDGRYVVQIGAFAEVTGAREARMKVEAMGLKTYTQVIESPTGRRIRVRVGPYATKAEADKAAARIKAGGLQAAVLVL
jgi:DedD protein